MEVEDSGKSIPKPSSKEQVLGSEEVPQIDKFDEADPLQDRTPAGDMGPEDNVEIKRGSTKDEASY